MRKLPRPGPRGLTIIEMMIALVLLSIVLVKITLVFGSAMRQGRLGAAIMSLEEQTVSTMEQLIEGLRAADFDTLQPAVGPPASSSWVEFETAQGFDGTLPEWSGLQRIELLPGGRIRWTEDMGGAGERTFFLGESVPDLLEGEDLDGTDQNGNDLVDESGLCFSVADDTLIVRLTLTRRGPEGQDLVRTMEARVVPRN